MKILHTADWHAGRVLRGKDRTPEIDDALTEIAALAAEEQVDLVLVAGDLFDKKNPSAEAERTVINFFLTLAKAQIPSVIIAGNHDAPLRFDAAAGFYQLAGVTVLGEVRVSQEGGTFDLTLGDETARIAALPFVSERRIVRFEQLLEGDTGQWIAKYREGMRKLITNLTSTFDSRLVNLLLLHTTMEGATLARSEFSFHCTENYTIGADALPSNANYVALGHIHKPQSITGYSDHAARYAGSLIQLDFGEAGDAKYVYIVEAKPNRPTQTLLQHEIQAGKRLKHVTLDGTDTEALDKRLSTLEEFTGWLKLSIKLDEPRPGLKDRIKAYLPNALIIDIELPKQDAEEEKGVDIESIDLLSAYKQYYEMSKGIAVSPGIEQTFSTLLQDVGSNRSPP